MVEPASGLPFARRNRRAFRDKVRKLPWGVTLGFKALYSLAAWGGPPRAWPPPQRGGL